jgi:Tfp pilus assembly protein PilX
MKTMHKIKQKHAQAGRDNPNVLANEDGAVIFVVLMALVTMTVIALVSSDSQITENLIIRNLAVRKQNVFLLDSALMRGYQEFMQISVANPANLNVNAGPNAVWFNDINNDIPSAGDPEEFINTIWHEEPFTQRCLVPGNSRVENSVPLLTTRGENGNAGLRYAIVGWEPVNLGSGGGSSSIVVNPNTATWHGGRLMAEYVSVDAGGNANGFGMLRQEMGLRRKW